MSHYRTFWFGFGVCIIFICSGLATWAFLDNIYDKGYEKGIKVGIEQGRKQTMKDIELSYDMCVKKKGE
ncbi:hypothetical protein JL_46 [Bacillus phage JL]|uniref:Uncharacterized protein n=1 Tax=Bacillus phage JL TaxID=1296655 RepID=S5MM37_9CAUD|nr:hypothetical protein AVV47_gp046 [Bacillus phage JL]AGR46735.1 hypothetical protein JL_46 [Bacillus phage JL]